jgi:hypothetical protein
MTSDSGPFEVHSAARGPHWISWVTRPGTDQPDRSIILVGVTKAEAEARARGWITSIYNSQFTIHK